MKKQANKPQEEPAKNQWSPPLVEKLGNLHEIVLQSGKSGSTMDGASSNFMN